MLAEGLGNRAIASRLQVSEDVGGVENLHLFGGYRR